MRYGFRAGRSVGTLISDDRYNLNLSKAIHGSLTIEQVLQVDGSTLKSLPPRGVAPTACSTVGGACLINELLYRTGLQSERPS